VVNSLTKQDYLICQTRLSDFGSFNSAASFVKFQNHLFTPPLGDIKGFSLDFTPTASLVGLGEKLSMDSRIGQPACCGMCREPFFSGAMTVLNSVDDFTKSCYMWTM
jgi:hypothetical protein